jgi:hypothetical protein
LSEKTGSTRLPVDRYHVREPPAHPGLRRSDSRRMAAISGRHGDWEPRYRIDSPAHGKCSPRNVHVREREKKARAGPGQLSHKIRRNGPAQRPQVTGRREDRWTGPAKESCSLLIWLRRVPDVMHEKAPPKRGQGHAVCFTRAQPIPPAASVRKAGRSPPDYPTRARKSPAEARQSHKSARREARRAT